MPYDYANIFSSSPWGPQSTPLTQPPMPASGLVEPDSRSLDLAASGVLLDPRAAAYFDYVTNDPTKPREEIKRLLENIRPDIELPPEDREGTPEAMKYPLMEHQKLGLAWLKNMEEGSNKGGILADDMGLGKTIQALALMVSRPSADRLRKTNLIVAPVALLRQWEREIQTKLKPTHQLKTFMLHGSNRGTRWTRLRDHDVVLTTYGKLASERRQWESWDSKRVIHPDLPEPELSLIGSNCSWYR